METIAQQIANLRLEIAAAIWQMTIGMWLITVLAVLAYLLASTSLGREKHCRLTMILVISGLFFTAREDYLIHRPAGYITMIEAKQAQLEPAPPANLPSWETYKSGLSSTRWFLPPIDVLAGLVWIFLFWSSANALRTDDVASGRPVNYYFLLFSKIGFFAGWVAPFVATYVANK